MNIIKRLQEMQDDKYKKFHSKLCPGKDNVLGVRVPNQKKLAKEIGEYLDEYGESRSLRQRRSSPLPKPN